ncbi:MAG: hypothetical protein RLZZ563_692 [Pseudomonadota bacterium]
MAAVTQDTAVRTGRVTRVFIYLLLLLFALFYLLPLYVMGINSVKPLSEITGGNMMALPEVWTLDPWRSAWSTAQIGVEPTGLKPYFLNSILMVVPAVAISTIVGALNGYVLTKWRFRGDTWVFGLMLFSCFIPFQIVLIPMAVVLGKLGLAGSVPGLILVHVVYGIGFTTLYFRNYYAAFPTELVRAAQIDGAGFFQIFWRILLPVSGPIAVVSVIVYATFVLAQTIRHRDYFIHQIAEADDHGHKEPVPGAMAAAAAAMLLAALVAVVLLAKNLSPVIEARVLAAGLPKAVVGIIIAAVVLAPEGFSALRAAQANRVQTSLNLAIGSALASIGLTIPAVALVALALGLDLELGLAPGGLVLLGLTLLVATLTLGQGRTTIVQGVIHLVIFATYLFTTIVP